MLKIGQIILKFQEKVTKLKFCTEKNKVVQKVQQESISGSVS